MSSSACASSSSRDDEKGAPSSREAKKITTSSSLLFSLLSLHRRHRLLLLLQEEEEDDDIKSVGKNPHSFFLSRLENIPPPKYNVHHPSTSLSSHDQRPVSPRPPRTRGWRQQRRRPLWRDGGVFPGGGTVVLRSRALSTRPEGWIYQDEFRYVYYTFGASLVCTRAIPHVAHAHFVSFLFLLRSRALSTRPDGLDVPYILLYLLCVHMRFRMSLTQNFVSFLFLKTHDIIKRRRIV